MKLPNKGGCAVLLALVTAVPPAPVLCAEVESLVVAEPVRYAAVNNTASKYQAHRWMSTGYAGGAQNFEYREKRQDGVLVEMEGRAVGAGEDDYNVDLKISREEKWYFKVAYDEFSKYYDTRGGTDVSMGSPESLRGLDRDLKLNIGKFELEAGLNLEHFANLKFLYEYGYKDGAKNRLTWGSVKQGSGANGLTRKIAPSFAEIDEAEHVYEFEASRKIAGYDVKATQRWELVSAGSMRQENNWASTGVSTDYFKRRQMLNLNTGSFASTLQADRWYGGDKSYFGMIGRYSKIKARELESVHNFKEDGFTSWLPNTTGEEVFDAVAHNDLDSYTVVSNGMFSPWDMKDVSVIARIKTNYARRQGLGTEPWDNGGVADVVPDRIYDRLYVRSAENDYTKLGEHLSVRYTGISKVALYTDLDFEQTRDYLHEQSYAMPGQLAITTSENWWRDTVTSIIRNVYALGAKFYVSEKTEASAQYTFKDLQTGYDNYNIWASGTTAPQSAFISSAGENVNEASASITYKPERWFRNTLRYKILSSNLRVAEAIQSPTPGKSDSQSSSPARSDIQIVGNDLYFEPAKGWGLTGTFQYQMDSTRTRAGSIDKPEPYPGFRADYYTWGLDAAYSLTEDVTLNGSYSQTLCDNSKYIEQEKLIMNLLPDYESAQIGFGLDWKIKKDVTVSPKYAYDQYNAGNSDGLGDYQAHMVLLTVKVDLG